MSKIMIVLKEPVCEVVTPHCLYSEINPDYPYRCIDYPHCAGCGAVEWKEVTSMAILRKIMTTCKDTQYCHECSVRDFCTQLRAKPPKYWPEKIVEKYDPSDAPAKKTAKKKKGE